MTATAERHAMPPLPGTSRRRYPINSPADVQKAVRATGRTDPARRPAVRRHVIAHAKRLGCSHLIPDTWNSDGTLNMSARVSAARLIDLANGDESLIELAGKWRHGWIPLDAIAAAIKAKKHLGGGGGRGSVGKSRIDVHAQSMHAAALTSGSRSKARGAPRVRNPHPGGLVGPKGPAEQHSLKLVGGVQPHEAVRMKRSELEQHAAAGSHVARVELKRRADKRAAMKPATGRAQQVAQDRHRANEAKRAEPQTFTRDDLRSASMGTDSDLKRQHAFAVEHGQAEHVTRTHAELEKRGYGLSGGKWTKGGAPAAKAARKPSAVHQDYMRERHAQDMRFEAHTGGGISAKDTHTQEYKDYFGLVGGSGRPVETRLTYKEHLSQRRADPQDKANMAAYDAGMKHGIAHGLKGTSPTDAEYNAASKGHSEEHFGSGFSDGVIAGAAKRDKMQLGGGNVAKGSAPQVIGTMSNHNELVTVHKTNGLHRVKIDGRQHGPGHASRDSAVAEAHSLVPEHRRAATEQEAIAKAKAIDVQAEKDRKARVADRAAGEKLAAQQKAQHAETMHAEYQRANERAMRESRTALGDHSPTSHRTAQVAHAQAAAAATKAGLPDTAAKHTRSAETHGNLATAGLTPGVGGAAANPHTGSAGDIAHRAAESQSLDAMISSGKMTIEHSGDGTLVHNTTKADAPALKEHGFRWSRTLGAWYLPRTQHESTRSAKVNALKSSLGDKVQVHRGSLTPSTTAGERMQANADRARQLADQHASHAARLSGEADARFGRAHEIGSHIPMGQPILVGHHSEGRHRSDLAKIDTNMRKGVEAHAASQEAEQRARSAEARARMVTDPRAAARRLDRSEAELRSVERKLNGTGKEIHGENTPATGDYAVRLQARRTELQQQITHDRGIAGDLVGGNGEQARFGKHNVKPGDVVQIQGRQHVVHSTGPKNAKLMTEVGPLPYPYTQIQGHASLDSMSTEALQRTLTRSNSISSFGPGGTSKRALPPAVVARIEQILKDRGVS